MTVSYFDIWGGGKVAIFYYSHKVTVIEIFQGSSMCETLLSPAIPSHQAYLVLTELYDAFSMVSEDTVPCLLFTPTLVLAFASGLN